MEPDDDVSVNGYFDMMGTMPLDLRPAIENDLTMLQPLTWAPDVAGEFAQFGCLDLRLWRRMWAENALIGDEGGVLMVERGTDSLGFVNWRRQSPSPACYYWEIGIALLPEAGGHG